MALFQFTFSDQQNPAEPFEAEYSGWAEARRVAVQTLGAMISDTDWDNGFYTISLDVRRNSDPEVVRITLNVETDKRFDPRESRE